ncbi:Zn-dependent hydrolase [Bosea psychrotolerans]|uniref:N-carbamoyl-L-amino-acid hydrolase n=1 Tax=Bosea psychrotolerans TaxID=1871628 RepID=A0A2S4LZH6_9HYPH|nr:Zn-dependent hydrolase [Bosea psychrotolerans]POR47749.1 N-carbamoyl-L-amino-acid hydrolase [Bosea psychrotolerans]
MTALQSELPSLPAEPDIALAERLFDELSARTGGTEGITRASYGLGEAIAHDIVAREAGGLGLTLRRDPALNLYATLRGRTREHAIMIGSHLDSVPNGGNYDGAAGVLAGLAVIAGIVRAGIVPPRDIVLTVIRAEESAWFNASYIGSRAAFGALAAAELDQVRRSDDDRSLAVHMREAGADLDALRAGASVLTPAEIGAFIEPHIEQGPVLLAQGAPVAIVTGIRGSARFRHVVCRGEYAHSGATPRALRRDAALAAAELTLRLDELWRDLEAEGEDLTITVGQFATDPAEHAFSKVAGRVDLSIDLRSRSPALLARAPDLMRDLAAQIARRRGVSIELGPLSGTEPALMDDRLAMRLTGLAEAEGLAIPRMACGAGHDAAIFANHGVPTAMIFIRNAHGSHNPLESMEIRDFAVAARILMRFCLEPGNISA